MSQQQQETLTGADSSGLGLAAPEWGERNGTGSDEGTSRGFRRDPRGRCLQSILLGAGHLPPLGREFQERHDLRGGLSTAAGNRSVIWGGPLMDIFHLEKCILVKTPLALQTHDLGFWFYFFLIEISIISNCEGFAASQACC